MANVSQNTGPGPVGEDLDQYSELDWMRWHSNRWTVAEWTEWWDSLSPSDQSYFGKLQMAFSEYFKATDVSEQSYQEELQRHRQEHSEEQAEALSDFHARQREDRSRRQLELQFGVADICWWHSASGPTADSCTCADPEREAAVWLGRAFLGAQSWHLFV